MRKFALVLFFCLACFGLCACAKTNVLSQQQTTNKANEFKTKQETLADKTNFVINYVNDNYDEYCFDRFIEFGVKKLVLLATTDEIDVISQNTKILASAIEKGENLSQKDLEVATGAVKAIFDIEKPLFRIWYREMMPKN